MIFYFLCIIIESISFLYNSLPLSWDVACKNGSEQNPFSFDTFNDHSAFSNMWMTQKSPIIFTCYEKDTPHLAILKSWGCCVWPVDHSSEETMNTVAGINISDHPILQMLWAHFLAAPREVLKAFPPLESHGPCSVCNGTSLIVFLPRTRSTWPPWLMRTELALFQQTQKVTLISGPY